MSTPFSNNRGDQSNDFYRDPKKGDKDFHFNSDVDSSVIAKHHTLGTRRNQATPGNHTHSGFDDSLFLPTLVKGSSTASSHTYNSASATQVSITEAVLSSVPLIAGRVYRYDFNIQISYNADTSVTGVRANYELRKTDTTGTLLSTIQYHRATSLQTNDTLVGSMVWVADATETITLSFSFARNSGGATFTTQVNSGYFFAAVSELSAAAKWTVTA